MATFTGTSRDDRISGSSGDDVMVGNGGNDRLSGNGGNDVITGNAGRDTLTGGAGGDVFRDTASGLNGDTIVDFQATDTIVITDASLASFTYTLSGRTLTYSGGTLTFGANLTGNLVVTAASGGGVQLQLTTGPVNSTITGTAGVDKLVGTSGVDQINGLAGNDTLVGNGGADLLNGGDDNDLLYSGAESTPYVFPSYGGPYIAPLLDTGTEADALNGGAGMDTLFAGYGDNVDGGSDTDDLFISFLGASSGVNVDFRLQTQVIGGGTITGIETVSWVQGTNYADTINVNWSESAYSDATMVFGMGGNDTLVAGYYTGSLDGGDGNDIVDGRGSLYIQSVYGGAGDDTLYTSYGAAAYGGEGNDTIYSYSVTYGGGGNDIIVISYSHYTGPVFGEDGNDQITGANDAQDTISGGAGADIVSGGSGNDTIAGNEGADSLTGGQGEDYFRDTAAGLNGDTIADFEVGDLIVITDADLATFSFAVNGNLLTYSGGSLTFGNALSGHLVAGAAPNGGVELQLVAGTPDGSVYGTSGSDRLIGTSGAEKFNGLGGNDVLVGGAGADVLQGGEGDDVLYAGAESTPYNFPYYYIPYTAPLLDTGTEVDTLIGGGGSDVIFAGYGDSVDGGDNYLYGPGDTLFISFLGAASGVTADFTLETQVIGGGTITGIENASWVQGSNFGDYINVASWSGYGTSDSAVVFGMGGNDTLLAGYYTALLDGGDGDDIVDGRSSLYLQFVYGGAGNDTLYTNSNGSGEAHGGDGDDIIYSSGLTHGGAGNDTILMQFSYYGGDIFGDDGDDHITGRDNVNDSIFGGADADTILAGSGDDILAGNEGIDSLTGGLGDDVFRDTAAGLDGDEITDFELGDRIVISDVDLANFTFSLSGNDLIYTGGTLTIFASSAASETSLASFGAYAHADLGGWTALPGTFVASAAPEGGVELQLVANHVEGTVYGSSGDDHMEGTAESDRLHGLGGSDVLAGGAGSDYLIGGEGDDYLHSGAESPLYSLPYYDFPYTAPVLDTGTEVDTLVGGVGSDRFFVGYGDNVDAVGDDDLWGDYLYITFAAATSGVTVDFRQQTQTIGGGTITHIEHVSWLEGSDFGDSIDVRSWYSDGAMEFGAVFGMGGNDTLIAGASTGTLDGGDGDDILDGRNSDYLQGVYGGAGDDTLYTNPNSFAAAQGGDGNDTIYSHGLTYGGAGNDIIIFQSSYYTGPAFGEGGNDQITGTGAADVFDGGAGNDTLTGGTGSDTLTGGADADTFRDTAAGLNGDTLIDFTSIDKIIITDANLATFSFSLSGSTLTYSGGVLTFGDTLGGSLVASAAAGGGVQLAISAPTTPPITGTSGSDSLNGTSGNDRIEGLAGSDRISGLDGADVLVGGLGADMLAGGNGADHFVYNSSAETTVAARDVIQDLAAIDRIDLSLIDAIDGTAANDAFSFIGSQTFHNVAGELRVVQGDKGWSIQGDTNGDGVADLSIMATLSGMSSLGADLFIL